MKILRAYIENFGKLEKQEFNFSDGFNVINEENGYGKTTLATFIKAMLYGMKSSTKKQLDENEKRKYSPWQGGNFGGFLEFQVGDNKYKVERFFGNKDSEDSFSLIDLKTGKKSNDYTSNLGEELFGLDEESYERCTFIPQKEIESGISDKLSNKLINMIQGTNSKDSFEQALNLVKEKSSELKKRGKSGKIAEVESEISEIKEEIDSLKSGVESLDKFNENIKEEDELILKLIKDKEDIEEKINKYSKHQEVIANKKYIDDKNKLKAQLISIIQEKEELLNGKSITDKELDDISSKHQELVNINARLKSLEEVSLNEQRYKQLKELFGENKVKEESIQEIIEKDEKLKDINLNIKNNTNVGVVSKPKKQIGAICFGVLSVICLALGIILLNKKIFSIFSYALAGVFALIAIIAYFKTYIDSKAFITGKMVSVKDQSLIREKQTLEFEINSFIKLFNNCEISNITSFLYDLKAKSKEISILETEIEKKHQTINELKEIISKLEREINLFFNDIKFKEELNINEKVLEIKNAKLDLEKAKKDLIIVNNEISEYNMPDLDALDIETVDISNLQNEHKELQQKIDYHKDRKAEYIRKIDKTKNIVENLEDLENRLDEKILLRNDLKSQYQILDNVSKFLTIANDNLTAKYKKPMQDNLNKYLKQVLKDKYKQFNIDTDLKVSFEEYGKEREVDYLSKGYRGVVNICIRFALIDSLFEKEKPFVILDDPFVNFDKDKIKNALNILKDFSNEYQLIYFVCHESRI